MSGTVPYGAWPSPIDAARVSLADGRPGWVSLYGSQPWWVAPMPAENGRVALVRAGAAGPEVVLPRPWSVRSRVHEYGGRAYVLVPAEPGPVVVFAEFSDQRLYRFQPDTDDELRPLTPHPDQPAGLRYVEPAVGPGGREVWCIREKHHGPASTDVTRAIVAVPLDGSAAADSSAVRIVVADRHFLACPRISPDKRRLSWIGWDHPSMPWDSTELRVAAIDDDGTASAPVTVAGGPDEAVVQAEWESSDALLYVSDPTGWWNLHRMTLGDDGRPAGTPVDLCPRDEEFGGALWQLGLQWFQPMDDGRVAVIHGRSSARLSLLDPATGTLQTVDGEHTEWASTLALRGSILCGVAGSPGLPYQVTVADAGTLSTAGIRGRLAGGRGDDEPAIPGGPGAEASPSPVDDAYLPVPQARTFAGPGGRDVHAHLYPPRNPACTAPGGELPPYVVFVHGGPTGHVVMVYDLEIAYFTSRGIGVVEVNYGGSTGHGRAYRNRLRENWGVVDVEDCVAVATALVDEGTADPRRLAIRGGSAGGWTSAAALVFTDVFRCAVIQYPIVDLAGWRTGETHDFESQYLESLVGPWPQTAERYRERSPSSYPERVSVPFLLLQGLDDEICPPVQAERFVRAVADHGVPHAYLTFEGEQHGFRKADTIVAALEAELSLYAQVFEFTPAGHPPRLELSAPVPLAEQLRH